MSDLSAAINAAWEKREQLNVSSKGAERDAVEAALDGLDNGALRVAEKIDGKWKVHEWLKKAVLLSFRLGDMKLISGAPGQAVWWDKVDSKFLGWDETKFRAAGFRAVPGAIVRRSAFIAKGAVLMPSFVNVGARVGEGTMIDTWATVGEAARPGWRPIAISPAAPGWAACWSRCRLHRPSSKTIALSAPAPKWQRV